jgi:quercetin dioxygenase-like cupin family protein
MRPRTVLTLVLTALALVPAVFAWGQLAGARWWAIPLSEDPGVSWILVTETPQYRVLRDFAEPGATRRMHHHAETTWHVLTVASGKLSLTVEGEPSVELAAGQSLSLKGGVNHTFTSVGAETATIVEVFGKARP